MTTLAFDFSAPKRSFALLRRESGGLNYVIASLSDSGAKTTQPLALVDQILRGVGLDRRAIETIAVGLGPGSYTGVRSALALAQGWQLATKIPVVGYSTVECLARQASKQRIYGKVSVIIDAQRGEFYSATYQVEKNGCEILEELRIEGREAVQKRTESGNILVGPEVTRWFDNGQVLEPEAGIFGEMKPLAEPATAGGLQPIYLRETQFVKAPPPRQINF